MSTTTTTKYDIETEVYRFLKAKHTFETARLGSPAYDAAERHMERIVERAERSGNLQALLFVLNGR
jgi:hypothetical protein